MPALYSASADKIMFFYSIEDDCYQNLLKDKKALSSAILTSISIDGEGCEDFSEWKKFFDDKHVCFYKPDMVEENHEE